MTDSKPETMSRNLLLVLLLVCLAGIGVLIYLVLRPGDQSKEAIISVVEARSVAEAGVNVMDVIDATGERDVTAVEGSRYKVLVSDEAREGASGIARIGGLVTFVPNTRPGDVAIIEVTRLKRSTADSILIEKLESGRPFPRRDMRPERAERTERTERRASTVSDLVGKTFRGTITDTGRDGDGITRVDGKVVFVEGALEGEHVEFIITDDAGRFARGEVVSKSDVPFGDVAASAPPAAERPRREVSAGEVATAPVQEGATYDVEITEDDRRQPGVNGVARIDSFVVFVPNAKVGERVRIRISDVRARAANAEVIERLGTAAP